MPNFDDMFSQSEQAIEYKGNVIIRFDDIPYKDGDSFLIEFESTNSEWKQGISLDVFGSFEIKGKTYPQQIVLWQDTSPKEFLFTLHEEKSLKKGPKRLPSKGLLGIKNVWDPGTGSIESWYNGAAMMVEEIKNGRRYRCNDGKPDDDFDDIVFTVTKVRNTYDK